MKLHRDIFVIPKDALAPERYDVPADCPPRLRFLGSTWSEKIAWRDIAQDPPEPNDPAGTLGFLPPPPIPDPTGPTIEPVSGVTDVWAAHPIEARVFWMTRFEHQRDRPIGTSNNSMRWRISGVGTWHVSDASDRTTHPDLQSRCRRRVPEGTVNHDECHDSDSELLLEGSSSTAAETWPQILVLVERRNTGERPSIRHPIVKLWDPHPTTNRRSSSCASAASLIHEPLLKTIGVRKRIVAVDSVIIS
ncbi:hypothetical protein BHM03_00013788 [Ensete ventricosum]|nr:hypothetical protein BHM03_00013788 [Ensete ventricosum]